MGCGRVRLHTKSADWSWPKYVLTREDFSFPDLSIDVKKTCLGFFSCTAGLSVLVLSTVAMKSK